MQGIFELVVIGFAQRRFKRAVQNLVQLYQIHIEMAPGFLHDSPRSNSRKRFVNGNARTSLIDRFGT